MIEVVTEDEVVAVYRLLGSEGEADAILVVVLAVRWEGEIR